MDKKRMTAANVEELMDIVRTIRAGEDPDIDKIREEKRKKNEALAKEAEAARASEREKEESHRRRKTQGDTSDDEGASKSRDEEDGREDAGVGTKQKWPDLPASTRPGLSVRETRPVRSL